MGLKELFTNDDGRLSTTNTIQVLSAVTLCIGFVVAVVTDSSTAGELGMTIAALSGFTATSKGVVQMKRGKDHE